MTKVVVTKDDLHTDDFVVRNGKVRTSKERQYYTLSMVSGNGASVWHNNESEERRNMTVQNGFGRIHLDFKTTNTGQHRIATLPANAPTPVKLIEQQLWDGTTVWLSANSRDVYIGAGATANRRYIVDMVGFFNVQ